jgi:hypothetical protein
MKETVRTQKWNDICIHGSEESLPKMIYRFKEVKMLILWLITQGIHASNSKMHPIKMHKYYVSITSNQTGCDVSVVECLPSTQWPWV